MYIGGGKVIQSTPYGPHGVSVWPAHNGHSRTWFFRVKKTKPNPPTPLVPDTGVIFYSSGAALGASGAVGIPALQAALLATEYATPEMRALGVTGIYNPETAASVALLQASMGYATQTGLLDPYSAARLGLTWSTG